MSPGNISEL